MTYFVDIGSHTCPEKTCANAVDTGSQSSKEVLDFLGLPGHKEPGGVIKGVGEGGEDNLPFLGVGHFRYREIGEHEEEVVEDKGKGTEITVTLELMDSCEHSLKCIESGKQNHEVDADHDCQLGCWIH
jgi:hypothetical protein